MKVDVFDVDSFVKVNHLQEVTNPIYLGADGQPTKDGIFSYEIFGYPGSRERKEIFAYIDFKAHVMNPLIYKYVSLMDKRIKSVIMSEDLFYINAQGELIKDNEMKNPKSGTGLKWLYTNWEKIKFKKNGSTIRDTKIDLLNKLKKNEIFVSKWPVIPAGYRDVNFAKESSGRIEIDDICKFYIRLISLAKSSSTTLEMGFVGNLNLYKIQEALYELYSYLTDKLSGKTGYTRNYLLGKNIDYSARAVISTDSKSDKETYKDVLVKESEMGIPIHMLCACFKPFIIKEIRDLLINDFREKKRIVLFNKEGSKTIDASLTAETITEDTINQMISLFENSQEDRFNEIYFIDKNGKKVPCMIMYNQLGRVFTLADLLYIACWFVIKDKYVFATRFPVESHQSVNIFKPVIVSTERTVKFNVDKNTTEDFDKDLIFENYPDINCKLWRDSAILDNTTTTIFGADFDGDMLSIYGVFSKDANDQLAKLIKDKRTVLNARGGSSRTCTNDCTQALYMLTRSNPKE